MGNIGFINQAPVWEGPEMYVFSLYTTHSRVYRYQAQIDNRNFDFYVPIGLLPNIANDPNPPGRLLIAFGRATNNVHVTLFAPREQLRVGEAKVFRQTKSAVNSIVYSLQMDRRDFDLYVPHLFFGDARPPERLTVQVGVES